MLKKLRGNKVDNFLSVDEVIEELEVLAENDLYYHNLCQMIKDMRKTNEEAYNAIREQIEAFPIQDRLDIMLYI